MADFAPAHFAPAHFALARRNMIDSQLKTSGVVSEAVCEAFDAVPREAFVPDALKGICYADEDLDLGNGQFLIEPLVLGQMIETLEIERGDSALVVGGAGYAAAVVSRLAGRVQEVDVAPADGLYDVIVVCGAVAEIPAALAKRLSPSGRMVCVVVPAGSRTGFLTLVRSAGNGAFSERRLRNASIPYLPEFAPRRAFAF